MKEEKDPKKNFFHWLDKEKPFVSYLVFIRRAYTDNLKNFMIKLGLIVAGVVSVSLLVDWLTPFESWGMILRSFILVPGSIALFTLLYIFSVFMHNIMSNRDPQWRAFRSRLSANWRLRVSIVVAVFIIILIMGTEHAIGYTLVSSFYGALFLSLLAFIRMTSYEIQLKENGVIDPRDIENKRLTYDRLNSPKLSRKEKKKAAQEQKANNQSQNL